MRRLLFSFLGTALLLSLAACGGGGGDVGRRVGVALPAEDGSLELHRSPAMAKDQSYVLGVLTAEQLAHSMFPIGSAASKADIRAEAEARGLAVAQKPDSYDICFIPEGDTRDWLGEHLELHREILRARLDHQRSLAQRLEVGRPAAVVDVEPVGHGVDRGDVGAGVLEGLGPDVGRRALGAVEDDAQPDQRVVDVAEGESLLDASLRAKLPHTHVCGGTARCSTCRVHVLAGAEHLSPPGED